MRRGLVHALAWSLATGAAVTLSWWGVHTVLSGTVYDPPRALPLPAGAADVTETAGDDPRSSSTRRPGTGTPSPPATTRATPGADPTTAPATPPAPPSRTPRPTTKAPNTAPADSGSDVKSYTVDGGRVTFDIGDTSAELVSATPASGWQMQVWKQSTWIRVTFTADGRELSVFCVWHDTAPRVEIEDRAV
ncbi:hypothetical protein ABT154_14600 [Streptomyces sp. NPDC001728]|uniref:hypothetical protein n=1 Tax=Streptomyces sp. NPDC001728 TaxID=3154396 RepID=UPI00332F758B